MKPSTARLMFYASLILFVGASQASAQSGREFRRSSVMSGNQVRTVFGNWGVIGQPSEKGRRGAWRSDNNGYLGDVSPMIGAEVKWDTLTFRSVVTSPVARPAQLQDVSPTTGKYWTLEPVSGYFNANEEKVALSNDPRSWPTFWPDKMADATDPGWRGSWNGYFGKRINADQEAYFVMDDNNDERFNFATNNPRQIAFKPDAMKPLRNGLGLEVRVRALQWGQFLAKDNIFWLYEITNTGTTTYDKVVFGMLVGTYIGVTSTEDFQEYRDDWSFYDAKENITYTGDYGRRIDNPLWVGQVGMVGYAFLESPGNPFDGIDNDGDADSSATGRIASQFTATSFDTTTITVGMPLVVISNDFQRVVVTAPATPFKLWTRGMRDSVLITPGVTKLVEGNILRRSVTDPVYGPIQVDFVNTNAYDGIDNDFDGLIDENFYVHYRQIKRSRVPGGPILIDVLRPLRKASFTNGTGTGATTMIDERRDDGLDNNEDWLLAKDDLGRDGLADTRDAGEGDGVPTSGYLADGTDTGLPGEPHIDKTDVRESDQIGLTSFYYFAPANQVRLGDDESLWGNLAPGFFDVPPSIVNNRPQAGEDGDFIYGSGYFPLLAGRTERFSLALVFGGGKGGSVDADLVDLLKNKQTVQKIYDANYKFPKAPDRPTLTAVAGDRKVTLYWDRKSEESVDEVLGIKDFEGYKILKSTDPSFSDLLTITDGSGTAQGYRPLAQFDIKNGIKGFFTPSKDLYQEGSGYAFYLGDDSGLRHSYVDLDVQNGRRYYYAVQAYDRGDEFADIFPSENRDFKVNVDPDGTLSYVENVAVVTPNAPAGGYSEAPNAVPLTKVSSIGTGSVSYRVVDPEKLTGHEYQLEFFDTQNDGEDNNNNGLIDVQDSTESGRVTTQYSVRDLRDITSVFIGQDTTNVNLPHKNLIAGTITVRNAAGSVVSPTSYLIDLSRGVIRGATLGTLPEGSYSITYQYYPVYRSPHIQNNPAFVENFDSDVFDGLQIAFENVWLSVPDTASRWVGTDAYVYTYAPVYSQFLFPTPTLVIGIRKPSDYRFEWASGIVDTSIQYDPGFLTPTPVTFRVYNETDSTYAKFAFFDNDFNNVVSPLDEVWFYEKDLSGRFQFTWTVQFVGKLVGGVSDTSTKYLGNGDQLLLRTTKPFRRGDVFRFMATPATTTSEQMTADLPDIRVVPNPYVTASAFEPPLNPGITSGRGTRKVDFVNVPPGSTINIFTSRGDHVATLQHDGSIHSGAVSWNLKTKENLDIAYGVYFYVVETPVGTKTGKLAIVK